MRNPLKHDRAFRVAFILMVGLALAVLIAECSGQRPGQSRVGWPAEGREDVRGAGVMEVGATKEIRFCRGET